MMVNLVRNDSSDAVEYLHCCEICSLVSNSGSNKKENVFLEAVNYSFSCHHEQKTLVYAKLDFFGLNLSEINDITLVIGRFFLVFPVCNFFLCWGAGAIKELVTHPHQNFDIQLPPFSENVCLQLALMERGLHDIEKISVPLSNLCVALTFFFLDHKNIPPPFNKKVIRFQ